MKKSWSSGLLLCAVSFLLTTGCSKHLSKSSDSKSEAKNTKVLYHCYNTTPYVTLDPSTEYSNGIMILQNVYETLTHYNDLTKKVEPLLATDWSENDDGTVWTFNLREDVTFHDGTKMTAAAVVASVERTQKLGKGAAYIWEPVTKVEAVGDYTVKFTCKYATPLDLVASAGYSAYVMSPNVIDKDAQWFNEGHDGGTGPYMIAKATGDTVVLSAYQSYRDGWNDNQYQNVIVKEVAESSARRQLLETGEAQLSSEFSGTDLTALRNEKNIVSDYQFNTFNNVCIFLNSASAPCNNVDFRRALSYAFPYKQTVEGVLDGNAEQSRGLIPAGLWGHDDGLMQYNFDLDKAKKYLDKSGIDVSKISLTATYMTGYDEYSGFLQLFQSNLKKLGIELKLRSMEWDEQWSEAQAPNPSDRQDIMVMIWWPDYASPASWFDSLIHSEKSIVYNLAYINDSDLDSLIDQADKMTVTDRSKAVSLYSQIQSKLLDQAYLINLYDQRRTYIVRNEITGVHENPAYATAVQYYKITRVK